MTAYMKNFIYKWSVAVVQLTFSNLVTETSSIFAQVGQSSVEWLAGIERLYICQSISWPDSIYKLPNINSNHNIRAHFFPCGMLCKHKIIEVKFQWILFIYIL